MINKFGYDCILKREVTFAPSLTERIWRGPVWKITRKSIGNHLAVDYMKVANVVRAKVQKAYIQAKRKMKKNEQR